MEDKSKPTEINPDDSSTEIKEENKKDQVPISEEKLEEKTETPKETKEDIEPEIKKPDEKEPQIEKKKDAKKPDEKSKKKDDKGKDFKYIVRLSNTDVDGEKKIVYGLASIKGIGVHMATIIVDKVKIDRFKKMGYLSDAEIEQLQDFINNIQKNAPSWMLNHQKDYETGKDVHLVGSEIDMSLRDEINIMKKIRSYRGIRHERGLRARGQRTRANNRRGLALGVSKKRE